MSEEMERLEQIQVLRNELQTAVNRMVTNLNIIEKHYMRIVEIKSKENSDLTEEILALQNPQPAKTQTDGTANPQPTDTTNL